MEDSEYFPIFAMCSIIKTRIKPRPPALCTYLFIKTECKVSNIPGIFQIFGCNLSNINSFCRIFAIMAYDVKYPEFGEYFKELTFHYSDNKGQEFLAGVLKCSQSLISKILKGYSLPTAEMVDRIELLWGVNISQNVEEAKKLYKKRRREEEKGGKAEMTEDAETTSTLKTKPRLPITAAAGVLSEYLGGVLAHECEQIPVVRSMPEYDFTMIVKGDSMEPKFEGGDEIACKQVNSFIEPGKTYVLSTRDGAVLKRLYPEEDGVRCVSYNHDEYPDFKIKSEDILGVYRVVGLIRI